VEHIEVLRSAHVDPAFQAEAILLFAAFGTDVIEERLDVLLHLVAEHRDDRFIQLEKVGHVVPTPWLVRRPALRLSSMSGAVAPKPRSGVSASSQR
jgi:hypothetical protein